MKPETLRLVLYLMNDYKRTGAKAYRKKQVGRLMYMLNDIIQAEGLKGVCLHRIGRKHVIGFWRRHEHLSYQTRKEYWQILNVLYQKLGKLEPPRPKPMKPF